VDAGVAEEPDDLPDLDGAAFIEPPGNCCEVEVLGEDHAVEVRDSDVETASARGRATLHAVNDPVVDGKYGFAPQFPADVDTAVAGTAFVWTITRAVSAEYAAIA
jgi:hypothetical protein